MKKIYLYFIYRILHEGIKKILFNIGIINCFDDIYIYIYINAHHSLNICHFNLDHCRRTILIPISLNSDS